MTTSTPARPCPRCGGHLMPESHLEGPEWRCAQCGHVDYGARFEPMRMPPNRGGPRRITTEHKLGMRL